MTAPVDAPPAPPERETVFDIRNMAVSYGDNRALVDTTLKIYRHIVTAVIGPSGCGKSTFIRSLNRMNDSIRGFSLSGQVLYHGRDVYGAGVNPVEVRRRIGMVFQKPNPFPKSIRDNVAWAAAQPAGFTSRPRRADRARVDAGGALGRGQRSLGCSALSLSGGQQQRLCIARAIADRARRAPARRAGIGARPGRDRARSKS